MAINQAHYQGGIVLYQGEAIVHHSDDVTLEFDKTDNARSVHYPDLTKKATGKLFVTTHRLIFLNMDPRHALSSFSMPFTYMRAVKLNQPIFGANNIEGICTALERGGFVGELHFKFIFSKGGAINTASVLVQVAARFHATQDVPPSYGVAAANLYEQPPPNYQTASRSAPPVNNSFAGTNMYVRDGQAGRAPFPGVYEVDPNFKSNHPAQYIPQYPAPPPPAYEEQLINYQQGNQVQQPSAPQQANHMYPSLNSQNSSAQIPQYPPQAGYQNTNTNQIYVPQGMPPSYEQSTQKKRD